MNDRKKEILIFALLLLFSSSISIWSFITESFATFVIMGLFAIRMISTLLRQYSTRMIIHIKHKYFEIKYNNYKYFHLFKKRTTYTNFFHSYTSSTV
ncbi:hypothetical protein PCV84_001761 [Staphylococcus pseudintermedius]|nr:hypothetical protein [Staphylococcus pseudintermedius]